MILLIAPTHLNGNYLGVPQNVTQFTVPQKSLQVLKRLEPSHLPRRRCAKKRGKREMCFEKWRSLKTLSIIYRTNVQDEGESRHFNGLHSNREIPEIF